VQEKPVKHRHPPIMRKYSDMRCRLLACFLAVCCLALGQNNKMSVEKLIEFVQSSQKFIEEKTMTDKQLAEFLSKVKLTEKLEPRVIEDLQALGIGQATLRALEKLRLDSQTLTTATVRQVLPDEPIPPPTSLEQGAILDDVRNYVSNYDKNLPDFICTEVEHRLIAPRPGGRYGGHAGSEPSYQESDTITNRLSYFDQKEEKKVILINSRPVTTSYDKLGGSTSTGDFGTMLRSLFERQTQAHFEWSRWATLRGRLSLVFSFRVEQTHSNYSIAVKDLNQQIVTGYTGEVFVDSETHQVTRLFTVAENIPPDFPVRSAQTRLDYDYADIGGHPFLLPYRGEVQMTGSDILSKNLLDYLHYKKYSADSAITYDIPANIGPIPDSKLQETPAVKTPVDCKDPKNKEVPECKNGPGKN
jgi:hypothetical protein